MSTTTRDNGYSLRGDIANQFSGVTLEIVSPTGVVVGHTKRTDAGQFRVDFVGRERVCYFSCTMMVLDAMPSAARVLGF